MRYEKKQEPADALLPQQCRVVAEKALAEGIELYQQGDPQSLLAALVRLEGALRQWHGVGDQGGEARTHTSLGRVYESLGRKEKALEQYLQSLPLWRAIGDYFREARTLNQIGWLYDLLGDQQRALDYYQRALPLWRASGIRKGEATTLHNIGIAYSYMGDKERALTHYHKSLSLWCAIGVPEEEARTLSNMGRVYDELCAKQRALNCYRQALSLWRRVADQRGEAVTLYMIGKVYDSLGDYRKALHYYRQALPLWHGRGDHFWEATALHSLGVIYNRLGQEGEALSFYHRALLLWRGMRLREKEARTLKEISLTYNSLGERQNALTHLHAALPLYHASGDLHGEFFTLYLLGSIHDSSGQRQKAVGFYHKVLGLYDELVSREMIDGTLPKQLHPVEDEGANWHESEEDGLSHYRRMRTHRRAVSSCRTDAFLLCYVALTHIALGEKRKALDLFNQALPLWRAAWDRNAEASTRYQIALIESAGGNFNGAIQQIEKGLEIIELLRTTVANYDLRISYLASVYDYYELYIDLLMRLHEVSPGEGHDAASLRVNESARGRSLLELLTEAFADIRRGVDVQLLERERTLQSLLNAQALAEGRPFERLARTSEPAAASKGIEALITEYQEVQAQIRATSPRYAALMQPVPLTLKEIQREVLDADTVLLEYSLGEAQSYLWAVTQTSLTTIKLPDRAQIETLARHVYALLATRNRRAPKESFPQRTARLKNEAREFESSSLALSRMMLGPVVSLIENKRLLIVGAGALQFVPFAALPEPASEGSDGVTPLVVNHEIVYLPSASTLAVLRRELGGRMPAPQNIAVFADPVFDKDDIRVKVKNNRQAGGASDQEHNPITPPQLAYTPSVDLQPTTGEICFKVNQSLPRLMFSRCEAESIFAVARAGNEGLKVLDCAASRATVTSVDLSEYRIIHFATHGLLNSEYPELSGIVLSLVDEQGQAQDGFLRLHEIYNLNLNAEVVVLSACQTGLGKESRGEGLIGLTRGFMYAGSARVVASLWRVDDEATAELMKHFYECMLKGGQTPAAALRKAQVELSRRKRWQSPFYWAGFVIQGEFR